MNIFLIYLVLNTLVTYINRGSHVKYEISLPSSCDAAAPDTFF